MGYTALYRKFRPENFNEVKGQDAIVKTLSNQIKNGKTGHAYLFVGTRGTGKTSVAKIFAKAVNCENPTDGSPCGHCSMCEKISAGSSLNVVEMDAASNNGVEDIRRIVDEVKYSPAEGKYRVYIIDEVHMLSPGAYNALLKTIEEPPEYILFILATTDPHKIPLTIVSRCQRYDFKRIGLATITARLREICDREGIQAEDDALEYIAKCGEGSMRDSLSLFERCLAFFEGEVMDYDRVIDILGTSDTDAFRKMLFCIHDGDAAGCMTCTEEAVGLGKDLPRYIIDLSWYLRNMLLLKSDGDTGKLVDLGREQIEKMKEDAASFTEDELIHYIDRLCELSNKVSYSTQKRIVIETELIRLCRPQSIESAGADEDRLRRLEAAIEDIEKGRVAVKASGPAAFEAPEEEVKHVLPEALPDEIIRLAEDWDRIVAAVGNDVMKDVLKKSKCTINSAGEPVLTGNSELDVGYLKRENEAINDTISELMEKQVRFKVHDPENKNEDAGASLDEINAKFAGKLRSMFNVEVEIEDED